MDRRFFFEFSCCVSHLIDFLPCFFRCLFLISAYLLHKIIKGNVIFAIKMNWLNIQTNKQFVKTFRWLNQGNKHTNQHTYSICSNCMKLSYNNQEVCLLHNLTCAELNSFGCVDVSIFTIFTNFVVAIRNSIIANWCWCVNSSFIELV